MRWITFVTLLLCWSAAAPAADPPMVEKYLHSGELSRGEDALRLALEKKPEDDQLRLGLGALQFFRATERLSQSLHKYGATPDGRLLLRTIRMPVTNGNPAPITYSLMRKVLEQLVEDLAKVEATLAKVADERVTLSLRLTDVTLNLDGGRKADDRLMTAMWKMAHNSDFKFRKGNEDFLVKFDRGDVAWLRAYCHLVSAVCEGLLAIDGKDFFDVHVHELFARQEGQAKPRTDLFDLLGKEVKVVEPIRLKSYRDHLRKVCELNRETWRFIRAESDNNHEWLPNPKQKGVLGLPVTDKMIDGCLEATGDLEELLQGRKLPWDADGVGLGFIMYWEWALVDGGWVKSITDKKLLDNQAFDRILTLFGDGLGVGYSKWFD